MGFYGIAESTERCLIQGLTDQNNRKMVAFA